MHRATISFLFLGALAACGGGERSKDQKTEEPVQETAPASPTARPAAFVMCGMCHSDVKGKNGLGPSLHGIVGRASGAQPGFAYSPAMKAANLTWDEATIDRFIHDPRALVPGTRMSYAGLKDARKRAEIIGYLKTLK